MTTNVHAAYVGNSVSTASPARLLVMLFERLVLDVQRGLDAQLAGDLEGAHGQLMHAQDIVMELHSSLDVDAFSGGPQLAAIYDYLHRQLVLANIRRDTAITQECLNLSSDLADTWRQAAMQTLQAQSA